MIDSPQPVSDGASQPAPTRSRLAFLPAALFAAMALMFVVSLLRPVEQSKLPSMLIGKAAPQLSLAALEGLSEKGVAVPGIAPADLARGGPVVVNFWQSSCAPCVAEHPLLIMLQDKAGVPLLGINYKDPAAGARRFLNRYGNPFVAVGVDGDGRAAIDWGVYGMPETFVVDGQGRVVYKHIGALTEDIIEKAVIPAINKAR